MNNEDIKKEIEDLEKDMLDPNFWNDKEVAQGKIKRIQELKDELEGFGKHDRGNAIINIFAGAGGDDAEDWVSILLNMYMKFADKNNYKIDFVDENQNSNGGYRSVTFEVVGKNAYGKLKNESGVHRLVRISPFNANSKRQTSFAMVEVIPQLDSKEVNLSDEDIDIEYTKASGPGGQNVNKRETAVRVVHKESGISVLSSNQRSQAQNKDKAMEILKGKLYKLQKDREEKEKAGLSVSKDTNIEWGSQIRSYVMHPYKMVKDHRESIETSDIDGVLNGEIDLFIG